MAEAIVKCRNKGYNDDEIEIDVILCYGDEYTIPKWKKDDLKYKTSWDMYKRKESIKNMYSYLDDYNRIMLGYPHVKFRYIVAPS